MKCFIYWTAKSSKPWSSQFWTQFKQLRTEAWKSQDFNGVWTRDLAIPVRRSNQLSYEATDVGSWVLMSPWRMDVKWYMKCFIYWTGFWNQVSHDHRSFERNLSNCEQKPEKVRTSTGFDDHGLLDFKSAVQYMKHFIYHFIETTSDIIT